MPSENRNKSDKIIRKYDNIHEHFEFILKDWINSKFCAIINESQLSFTYKIEWKNINTESFFLIPNKSWQKVKLDINAKFLNSNSKILIHVISLANDNAEIILNGNLHIAQWIKSIEARLYEETLLLWNGNYISMIPWLKVDSPDVITSHWAKIQRISPERLFYMQSRGLNEDKAKQMIINSYFEQISDKMQLNEEGKSDFYSMIN